MAPVAITVMSVAADGATLKLRLPPARMRVLRAAARAARAAGTPVYLIGGAVRDLLLDAVSPDLDVCVVGDGLAFARALARELGAEIAEERRFLTAKLHTPDGAIDVATARRETYARPGALPQVAPGDIADDLARRDFTVNAMALRLDGPRRTLLDPFGGRADLARRQLRVLHDRSFRDDPTRLLRAARYAARLSLHLEGRTLRLAKQAVSEGGVDTVSGARLRRELLLLLAEPRADVGLALCARVGVLSALHPALQAGTAQRRAVRRAGKLCEWLGRLPAEAAPDPSAVRFIALCAPLTAAQGQVVGRRLALSAALDRALTAFLATQAVARRELDAPHMRRSAIVETLQSLPVDAVLALAATSPARVTQRCRLYLQRLRHVRARVRGDDLAALGYTPGPAWGRALAAARAARLDGRARSKRDELRVAQAALQAAGARAANRPIVS